MNNQGIIFDSSAPIMEGTWFNPKTGDVIKVRDSFFDNNNYMVRTTDGRVLSYNQLQNYVRDDSKSLKKQQPVQKPTPKPVQNKPVQKASVDVDELLTADDAALLEGLKPAKNDEAYTEPKHVIQEQFVEEPKNVNEDIIERALNGFDKPFLKVLVDWNAPLYELGILKSVMGITEEDIAQWMSKSLKVRDLSQDIDNSINEYLKEIFKPAVVKAEKPVEKEIIKKAPVKSKKKTTKSKK